MMDPTARWPFFFGRGRCTFSSQVLSMGPTATPLSVDTRVPHRPPGSRAAGTKETPRSNSIVMTPGGNSASSAGGSATGIHVDVTQRDSVQSMVTKSIDNYGQVDFLFNSAGSAIKRAKFLEIDDDLWDRTYDLNVKGTFYAMQETIPHMLERGQGVIVNVASMAARMGGPGKSPHYASAKGAVDTLTLGAAREFADQGIRVLSISPAIVDTPFQDINEPGMMEDAITRNPMGRAGRPEEIGELVLFMCSDACEFMIADTVKVSGGSGWR